VAAAADRSFTVHVGTHLLLAMVAPLLLVPAAAVTLLLRALPVPMARGVARALRWLPVRVLAHPWTATILAVCGMCSYYLTGLYPLAERQPVVHLAVHAHMLAAGYLFAYAIVGTDPAPHRPDRPHGARQAASRC
jgi:putative membrane protein